MDFELPEDICGLHERMRKFINREFIPIVARCDGLCTSKPVEVMGRRSPKNVIGGDPLKIMGATLARDVFKMYQ